MLKIFNSGSQLVSKAQDMAPAWRLDLVGHDAHVALPTCLKQLLSYDAKAHGANGLQVAGARIGANGEIDRVYLRGPWNDAAHGVNRQEWAFDVEYLDSSDRLLKSARRFNDKRWLRIRPKNDQEWLSKGIFGDFTDGESEWGLNNDMFMVDRLFRLNKAGRIDGVVGHCGSLDELIVRARLMGRDYNPTPIRAFTPEALSCFFRMGLKALPPQTRQDRRFIP